MSRGILSVCYARPRGTVTTEQLVDAANAMYAAEPFIKVFASTNGRSAPVGGETKAHRPGSCYFVPPGVVHSAKVRAGTKISGINGHAGRGAARH